MKNRKLYSDPSKKRIIRMNALPQSDLNWNLLRMFYMIAKEESITKAAKRLGLSQPSVSNALQKLEAQLGCQLVFRDSRHFELTTRGERFFRNAARSFTVPNGSIFWSATPKKRNAGKSAIRLSAI